MRHFKSLILASLLLAAPLGAQAGNGSDAVVGSIIGGATGAILGNGFGGRDGAIVGGAIGAAAGVAIATDNRRSDRYDDRYDRRGHDDDRRYGYAHDDDRRYRDYDRGYRRDVVVVESPRYYYRGNDFVYGRPSDDDRGHRGRGRGHGHHHHHHGYRDQGPDVVIIERDRRRW